MDIQALFFAGLAKYQPNISEIQSCEWVCDLHRSNSANISPMMSDEFCHWPTNLTSLQIASLDFCLGRACFLRICHWLTGWDSYWHQGESGDWMDFKKFSTSFGRIHTICVKYMKNISKLHNARVLVILEPSGFILELMQETTFQTKIFSDLSKKVLWRTL